MTLIDMASRIQADFRLFTIDTEFLFPETYSLMDEIEERYGIRIEKVNSSLSPEQQEREHGPALWSRDPDRCCNLRKVEPLRQKLVELAAWITSIRRTQTSSRAGAHKIEWDAKFGLVKINPIADWSAEQVWRYLHEHRVPYNQAARPELSEHRLHPLHARHPVRGRRSRRALVRVCQDRVRSARDRTHASHRRCGMTRTYNLVLALIGRISGYLTFTLVSS
jgi:3'-phosphoadenosine 5'-phosphosulfate sulfotransferase (PAPS reductase)/FAD synthetase